MDSLEGASWALVLGLPLRDTTKGLLLVLDPFLFLTFELVSWAYAPIISNPIRHISWLKWDTLCLRKEVGGMGFQNLHLFNLAMLGKHGWNFISKPHALAGQLIKAKYFLPGDFLSTQLGSNPSYTWKSIWSAQSVLARLQITYWR